MHNEAISRDPLTRVYSRAAMNVWLGDEFERARRYEQSFSIVLIDIDHFKSVNDAFGHSRGDSVLMEFARRLEALTRKTDAIFRYGGDEFVLLLPHTDNIRAATLCSRLIQNVNTQPFTGTPPLSISLSIGIATYPQDGNTPDILFEVADYRHYQAKRSGRGQVVSEGFKTAAVSPLDELPRLVERDTALDSLHNFLDALPEHRRGVLRVEGEPGTGRTRFLAEARHTARLLGYAVLGLQGRPAVRARVYGALCDALQAYGEDLPSPQEDKEAFLATLQRGLEEKGQAGLVVTIDNPSQVDRASLEFWRDVFFTAEKLPLALVYAARQSFSPGGLFMEASLRSTASLKPLSLLGVRVWLRHSLQWEAPQDFLDWFHRETGGLPAAIRRGLAFLLQQEVLKPGSPGWICREGFESIRLADWLAAQWKLPVHNFSFSLPDFVGREAELGQLKGLLVEQPLVTVLGPGGLGKTRLALQAAAESLENFPNGVYLVSLAPVRSADFLVSTIAEALRFSLSGSRHPKAQLLGYLQSKSLLLVMDGYEHLADETALLVEIRESAPGVHLLVTSRERLNLPGELLLELRGLPYPEPDEVENPEAFSAIQLFLHRARLVRPDFSLSTEEGAAVARICRLVAGMPLGIELAAAWVQTMSAGEIAAAIETSLAFLGSRHPEQPGQFPSLAAALDSFWKLFSPAEHRVLRRLSIFRGEFGARVAQEVAGASPFFLDALVLKAHVQKTPGGRYLLHDLLRQYAAEKLDACQDERNQALDDFCAYYANFLNDRLAWLKGGGRRGSSATPSLQQQALDEIGAEIENVRAAWGWALSQKKVPEMAAAAESLYRFFEISSWFAEGCDTFAAAARIFQSEVPRGEQGLIYARLLDSQGWFEGRLGRFTRSRQLLHKSLAILRRLGQPFHIALCLNHLGYIDYFLGEYEEGRQVLQESLALSRQLGDLWGVGFALNYLGNIFWDTGAYDQGQEHYQASLDVRERAGDLAGAALSMNNLGYAAYHRGQYPLAKDFHQQSLALLQTLNNRAGIALALNNLGYVSYLLGDYAASRQYQQESLAISREIGDRLQAADALHMSGVAEYALGNYLAAEEHLRQGLETFQELGVGHKTGHCLSHLGMAALFQERYDQARELLDQGLATCEQQNDIWGVVFARSGLAKLATAEGQLDRAVRLFIQALQDSRAVGSLHLPLDALFHLAQIWTGNGRKPQAYPVLRAVYHHPASQRPVRQQAGALLAEIENTLSPVELARLKSTCPLDDLNLLVSQVIAAASTSLGCQSGE